MPASGTKRDDAADIMKGILVLQMVLCHCIQFFGRDTKPVQKQICEAYGAIPAQPSVIAIVDEGLAAQASKFPPESIQKVDWKVAGNYYQDWMTELALW